MSYDDEIRRGRPSAIHSDELADLRRELDHAQSLLRGLVGKIKIPATFWSREKCHIFEYCPICQNESEIGLLQHKPDCPFGLAAAYVAGLPKEKGTEDAE